MKIKNLNLNFNCLKKFKNLKRNIKQLKNVVIAGVLIMTLSACGVPGKKNNNTSSSVPTTITVSTQIEKENIDTFNYLNLYDLDTNYSKYVSASKNIEHTDLKITGELTQGKLYEVVKSNNDRYMKNMKGATTYDELSNSNLKEVCGYIVNIINGYSYLLDDINEVYCVLSNLKIFTKDTLTNASVSDNDVMVISDKFFSVFKKKDMTLEEVVSHEAIHLMQKSCKDRLEKNELYTGISKDFQDNTIENFTFSWLYEASAEKCSSKQLGESPIKYLNDIHYLELFNFVSLDSEFKLEELCLNKDVDKLFKKFNCYNDVQKKELLNMLFTIEIIANNPSNISSKLYNTFEDATLVKKQMKRDVYKYYTKLFFQNLSYKQGSYDKETLYKTIALYEAMMISELALDMTSQVEVNLDFMNYYMEQKNIFLENCSSFYGINAFSEYEEYTSLIDKEMFHLTNQDKDYNLMLKSFINKYSTYLGKCIYNEELYETKRK